MKKWRYIMIASLLVFGLACGLVDAAKDLIPDGDDAAELIESLVEDVLEDNDDDGESTSGDEDDEDDTDIDEPEDDDSDEMGDSDTLDDDISSDGSLMLDDDALDMLDSYRQTIYFEMTYADGTQEVMDMELAATRDPAASQVVIVTDGEEIEMIQIEESAWIRFDDQWLATSSADSGVEDFGDFMIGSDDLDIDSWDEDDYTYLGKETINNIKTRKYEAEYNEFWINLMDDEEVGDVEDATALFWIADQNNLPKFIVKMEVTVEGQLNNEATGWVMTQEMYDVNEPFAIDEPEGVTSGMPEGVPEYPGATEFASFGGMVTFTTEDAVEDVVEFFTTALEDAGWSQDEYSEMGGMVTASYSLDAQTLTMMVTADDASTSVILMTE